MTSAVMVMTTLPSEAEADRVASLLVESQLAACVQILPIRSVYRWERKVAREPEFLLLIKTLAGRFDALKARLKVEHPYDVPEILELSVGNANSAYLAWLAASVGVT